MTRITSKNPDQMYAAIHEMMDALDMTHLIASHKCWAIKMALCETVRRPMVSNFMTIYDLNREEQLPRRAIGPASTLLKDNTFYMIITLVVDGTAPTYSVILCNTDEIRDMIEEIRRVTFPYTH